ncbi:MULTISPECIES: hypothetical protein [unclassified Pseudoalteromonas]|uniref:hypothetical protein n=1 Tax=unclassified Pseudoalteromonas TaxID=194690 RepID=UPI0003F5DD35|nr:MULTISPECIES: hypothetical protein [unclassified Pseudoalteromonas]
MNIKMIIRSFAQTLVEIDTAIATNKTIDFKSFINDTDDLTWFAITSGNIVPDLYVKMIDQALGELSIDLKGKYIAAYSSALNLYNKEHANTDIISIISESDWYCEDDRREVKNFIGLSDKGYHFGYLDDFPESEIYWDADGYSSILEAQTARHTQLEHIEKLKDEAASLVLSNLPVYDFDDELIPF